MLRAATRELEAGSGPGYRDWDGMVVLCATHSYSGIKMPDRHLAEPLSRLVPVLYVDPPQSVLGPLRHDLTGYSLRSSRLSVLGPGLARLTPVVQPCPSRRALAPLTSALARRYVRKAVARLGGRAQAVISAWPQYPVFGSCGEDVRVYWPQDDFVGGAKLLGPDARASGYPGARRGCRRPISWPRSARSWPQTWRSRGSATAADPERRGSGVLRAYRGSAAPAGRAAAQPAGRLRSGTSMPAPTCA